ncbi:MAG: molybdopterin molybdotransferase MoeA [Acidimicrobiia bacterium]|nr:MAG: molybdopterin molybdotransferase MoeA [Acidimicrobiia bacterium]
MRPRRQVQAEVLDALPQLEQVRIDPKLAVGLALVEPIDAPEDIPGFANSAMDGYAVQAASVGTVPADLEIIGEVAAGSAAEGRVVPGTAYKIMTGAPLPEGADAIVRVEATEAARESIVRILESVSAGEHVRPAGGDIHSGARVFEAGLRIGPAHASVLASLGVAPLVRRRPVVATMATGDELVPPLTPHLGPGQIRDSNTTLMRGLLEALGCEVVDFEIVGDDPGVFQSALDEAAASADVIVTSGGVSMGDYDVVKALLQGRGVDFWQVAMQPGKPFAFGAVAGKPFFGLPGNPVSVFVSFEQFVRPALLHMLGANHLFRDRIDGVMGEPIKTHDEKDVFVRVKTTRKHNGVLEAWPSGGQSSNVLSALALADALAVVPVGTGAVEAGETVELEMIHWPEARSRREVLDG